MFSNGGGIVPKSWCTLCSDCTDCWLGTVVEHLAVIENSIWFLFGFYT